MILTHVKAASLALLAAGAVAASFVLAAAGPNPQPSGAAAKIGAKSIQGAGKAFVKGPPVRKAMPDAMKVAGQPVTAAGMMEQMMRMGGGGAAMSGEAKAEAEFHARLEINVLAAALAEFESGEGGKPKKGSVEDRLGAPLAMAFADPTPLHQVLKHIKSATAGPNDQPIPIYVDPKGLEQAETSLDSTVTIDLRDVPLKTSLRLVLKQLGLAYCVRDGVLIISSVQGIHQELAEAASAAFGSDPNQVDEVMGKMGIRTRRGLQ
jgi:hypothetical protein